MINNIIWFWNLVHYNVFIWENKITNFVLYPFLKLLGTKKAKSIYAKRNVSNPDEIVKDALLNPEYGTNSLRSFGFMGMLIVFILFGFIFIFEGILKKMIDLNIFVILLITAAAYAINYFLLSKDKRYLSYFKEFYKLNNNDKRNFSLLTFCFIIIVILLPILSFFLMDKMLNNY
jgi:hypothetical protein